MFLPLLSCIIEFWTWSPSFLLMSSSRWVVTDLRRLLRPSKNFDHEGENLTFFEFVRDFEHDNGVSNKIVPIFTVIWKEPKRYQALEKSNMKFCPPFPGHSCGLLLEAKNSAERDLLGENVARMKRKDSEEKRSNILCRNRCQKKISGFLSLSWIKSICSPRVRHIYIFDATWWWPQVEAFIPLPLLREAFTHCHLNENTLPPFPARRRRETHAPWKKAYAKNDLEVVRC